jgi:alpha-ketoglutarate-dependent taurine dioxygenase
MTAGPPTGVLALGPVTGQLAGNGLTSAIIYSLPPQTDPGAWAGTYREPLRMAVMTHGAVMLRGLPVDLTTFRAVVTAVGGTMIPYRERSTPRTQVDGDIYTSTEYPPDQRIPLHNENSYSASWPSMLFFLCERPAESGGATPIASSRAVFETIPAAVRDRFADGVRYTRAFREGLGLSWQEAFQTGSPAAVERYCRQHSQQFEWAGPVLRTSHVQPAWRPEPRSGAQVWFNQAHLFHVSALEEEVREALLLTYGERDLPRNAYLADGRPIPAGDLAAITAAYDRCELVLPWENGSLLIIDNMLTAHGRAPYRGSRRVLVAMT